MIDMEEISARLCLHEGIKLEPYKCPKGHWTIGVGRNLETNPITPEEEKVIGNWRHGITKDAAFYLLGKDIRRVMAECQKKIPFWKYLDAERKYALLDMAFNLGINRLLRFKKMLSEMAIGNYRGAAKECLNSKYARDVGKRAERIAKTIETGEFKP